MELLYLHRNVIPFEWFKSSFTVMTSLALCEDPSVAVKITRPLWRSLAFCEDLLPTVKIPQPLWRSLALWEDPSSAVTNVSSPPMPAMKNPSPLWKCLVPCKDPSLAVKKHRPQRKEPLTTEEHPSHSFSEKVITRLPVLKNTPQWRCLARFMYPSLTVKSPKPKEPLHTITNLSVKASTFAHHEKPSLMILRPLLRPIALVCLWEPLPPIKLPQPLSRPLAFLEELFLRALTNRYENPAHQKIPHLL